MTERNISKGEMADPGMALLRMASGAWVTQAIYVAAKLALPDHLKSCPASCDELARRVNADPQALYRLMRSLVALGILQEVGEDRFAVTPLGEALTSDAPHSVHPLVLMLGEENFRAWGALLHSVRTGEPAFNHIFGRGVYDYLAQHAEAATTFNRAMTSWTQRTSRAVVAAYDFSPFEVIVDVGGGRGMLLAAILGVNPHLKGILFDRQHVIDEARAFFRTMGLEERCEFISGDFFHSVPGGGDVYILSQVIHNWNDERSEIILENCHRAMSENGVLMLLEMVVSGDKGTAFANLFDLNMMVMTGGRERTEGEFRALLDRSGFALKRIIPTGPLMSIVEAVRK